MHRIIEWQDLGLTPYLEAWRIQDELRNLRTSGMIRDRFLFVEHPPVFTLGKRDCSDDFVTSMDAARADGIEIVKCNRGGRVTYHGPGQIVGYFIFDISKFGLGVHDFVRSIEDICLRSLEDFSVSASRDDEHPGLWCGKNKIVAIGLHVSHDVTQHGFAMNVDCDLTAYRHIVACGIRDRGVTSLEMLLGKAPATDAVKKGILHHMGDVLSTELVQIA